MIQANELRIGNFLNSERFGICQVITIYKNNFDVSTEGKHKKEWFLGLECNPITITEEWLLNFGFEKVFLSKYRSKFNHNEFHFIGYEFLHVNDNSLMYGFTYYGRYLNNIEYVHQLQNLYFALTQTELEIK